jgi:hypothetical protein
LFLAAVCRDEPVRVLVLKVVIALSSKIRRRLGDRTDGDDRRTVLGTVIIVAAQQV